MIVVVLSIGCASQRADSETQIMEETQQFTVATEIQEQVNGHGYSHVYRNYME